MFFMRYSSGYEHRYKCKNKEKAKSKHDELLMKIDAKQFETRDSEVLKRSLL